MASCKPHTENQPRKSLSSVENYQRPFSGFPSQKGGKKLD